jgi:hypothetical protein
MEKEKEKEKEKKKEEEKQRRHGRFGHLYPTWIASLMISTGSWSGAWPGCPAVLELAGTNPICIAVG